MLKTTDDARQYFKDKDLEYKDISRGNVQQLRRAINKKMIDSKLMGDTLRCRQRAEFHGPMSYQGRIRSFWAGIECRSFYFDDREAVSFNRDGFIGFAGWADSKHIRPILDGFEEWVDWMALNKRSTTRKNK